jgi:hypothetical protein
MREIRSQQHPLAPNLEDESLDRSQSALGLVGGRLPRGEQASWPDGSSGVALRPDADAVASRERGRDHGAVTRTAVLAEKTWPSVVSGTHHWNVIVVPAGTPGGQWPASSAVPKPVTGTGPKITSGDGTSTPSWNGA